MTYSLDLHNHVQGLIRKIYTNNSKKKANTDNVQSIIDDPIDGPIDGPIDEPNFNVIPIKILQQFDLVKQFPQHLAN